MKTTKIQISIEKLEQLIQDAKLARTTDNSLSHTLEIKVLKETDTLTGSDDVSVKIISSYQDAQGLVVWN
jgi:oligoribonuclease NrnB/cAMP/cGMP phosphodiesterase (DHH superfamily)